MPRYRIQPGATFRQPDGTLLGAGDEIQLEQDVADMHASRLQLLPDDEPAPDANPAPDA